MTNRPTRRFRDAETRARGDDATRIERRRPSFAPWIFEAFRVWWIIIGILLLFILAGLDISEALSR